MSRDDATALPSGRPRLPVLLLPWLALAACSVPPAGWPPDTGHTGVSAAEGTGVLLGTVEDEDGQPIEGVHLVTLPHGYEAAAGAAGDWRIERLPPGTYQVQAALPGWETVLGDPVDLAAGDELQLGFVLAPLAAGGQVRVHVDGPDDLPLEAAIVESSTGDQAVTDSEGDAVLDGLGGQVVTLSVSDADGAMWGRTIPDVEVPAAGGVQASVQLSGRPAADATWMGGGTFCSGCHPDVARYHDDTPHGHALSDQPTGELANRFASGDSVDLDGSRAFLSESGGEYRVTLEDASGAARQYTVDGLIGSVDTLAVPWTELGDQAFPLPICWVPGDGSRPSYPGADSRLVAYHPERWFDTDGYFSLGDGDRPDPSSSADARCFPCHATGFDLTMRADGGVDLEQVQGGDGRWNDAQVSCERCHGPGSSHVEAGDQDKPFLITRPDLLDPDRANQVCGQCHSATTGLGTGLPYPYADPGGFFHAGDTLEDFASSDARSWPSGAAAGPHQQLDELLVSPHGSSASYPLRCFDCHDPHGASTGDSGEMLPASSRLDPRDNTLCLSCHQGLSFGDDADQAAAHPAHSTYDPGGASAAGRCTACHMPGTAAGAWWSEDSGAGDLSSHLFEARPPQDTLDAFDAAGASTMDVGTFPIHGCSDCHAWNSWRYDQEGWNFTGPTGDPTLRSTHEDFQDAYEEKFP